MDSVEIGGQEIPLEGNPSMGTVKYVQEMQIDIMRNYLSDEQIAKMDSMENDDVMDALLDAEGGLDNLKGMMWENSLLQTAQTIILATDHKFSISEFEEMPAKQFKEVKEAAEIALGTKENPETAMDFMAELGIGTSSKMREIQEEAEQRTSETDSPSPLLSE